MADLESTYVRIGHRFSAVCSDLWWLLAVLEERRGLGEQLISGIDRARHI